MYLEGDHRIIHNTVNFKTLQLITGVAGKRRAKFHSANGFLTALVFHSPLAHWVHFDATLHAADLCYFPSDNLYQVKLHFLLGGPLKHKAMYTNTLAVVISPPDFKWLLLFST